MKAERKIKKLIRMCSKQKNLLPKETDFKVCVKEMNLVIGN